MRREGDERVKGDQPKREYCSPYAEEAWAVEQAAPTEAS